MDVISYKKAKRAEELADQIIAGQIDVGVLQTKINEKLNDLETQYSPRLTNAESQLAEKATEIDSTNLRIDELVIGSGNANAEVTDAHVSTFKNKTFTTIRNRLEEAEENTGALITNIITNGDFNDTTGWSANASALSAANNVMSLNSWGTSVAPYVRYDTAKDVVAGHKIYVRAKVRVTNADCSNINLQVGGSNGYALIAAQQNAPVANTWYEFGVVYALTASSTNKIRIIIQQVYPNTTVSTNAVMEVQYVSAIDLTEKFGAGNEPTAEDFNLLMSYFKNKWFKTANVSNLIDYIFGKIDTIETALPATTILKTTDNLQTLLDSGKRYIQLDPSVTYSFNNITIPSGTKIIGNGATITSPNTTNPVFKIGSSSIASTTDVLIKDIIFRGSSTDANNLASVATDIAINMVKTGRVTITGCSFHHFLGAGISTSDFASTVTRETQGNIIQGNSFNYCYYGFLNWLNSEYGVFSNNEITNCRCGIWSLSGNWNYSGNVVVRCRAAFVSVAVVTDIVTSTGNNFQHGSVVGNTFNHDLGTQTTAWSTSNYLIGSVDYQGVWIDGTNTVIPPTFNGNTLYYTNLYYFNSALSNMPLWNLIGCTFGNNVLSCDVTNKVTTVGCTEYGTVSRSNVTKAI